MNLRNRLSRILHNAIAPRVGPAGPANVGRTVGRAEVPNRNSAARQIPAWQQPQQVDGPTVQLPPMQSRYQGRYADMKARNRQSGLVPARPGSTRAAVGL